MTLYNHTVAANSDLFLYFQISLMYYIVHNHGPTDLSPGCFTMSSLWDPARSLFCDICHIHLCKTYVGRFTALKTNKNNVKYMFVCIVLLPRDTKVKNMLIEWKTRMYAGRKNDLKIKKDVNIKKLDYQLRKLI